VEFIQDRKKGRQNVKMQFARSMWKIRHVTSKAANALLQHKLWHGNGTSGSEKRTAAWVTLTFFYVLQQSNSQTTCSQQPRRCHKHHIEVKRLVKGHQVKVIGEKNLENLTKFRQNSKKEQKLQ